MLHDRLDLSRRGRERQSRQAGPSGARSVDVQLAPECGHTIGHAVQPVTSWVGSPAAIVADLTRVGYGARHRGAVVIPPVQSMGKRGAARRSHGDRPVPIVHAPAADRAV